MPGGARGAPRALSRLRNPAKRLWSDPVDVPGVAVSDGDSGPPEDRPEGTPGGRRTPPAQGPDQNYHRPHPDRHPDRPHQE